MAKQATQLKPEREWLTLGHGIRGYVDDDELVVRLSLDVSKGTTSASGKSRVLASTHGNVDVAGCKLGVNLYRKITREVR